MTTDLETWGMEFVQGTRLPPTLRVLRYHFYTYMRTWRSSLTTSFLAPVLYLAAMGVSLGSLINRHVGSVDHVAYLSFVAPGLLAASAMQVAASDSMYPVMAAIKWIRTYHAMLATPLRVTDVLLGHFAWVTMRLILTAVTYLGVMAAFGVVQSPLAIAAVPAAILTGLSFSSIISAFAATQENDQGFATISRMGLIPLFLLSATFFPLSQLPGWMHPVAYATPLFHGVDLCRMLVLGRVDWASAGWDLAYLVALSGFGVLLARRLFAKRLVV
ncbi:MAG TPA: ABC transporter permease [Acidimicrobiales bacterium]|nr:ABC transporter permease [Acidimicrobiales bacterium]